MVGLTPKLVNQLKDSFPAQWSKTCQSVPPPKPACRLHGNGQTGGSRLHVGHTC